MAFQGISSVPGVPWILQGVSGDLKCDTGDFRGVPDDLQGVKMTFQVSMTFQEISGVCGGYERL